MPSLKVQPRSRIRSRMRIRKSHAIALLAAVMALPVTGAAMAEETSDAPAFAQSFDRFGALPAHPVATGDVVDITQLQPPVDAEQEQAARFLGKGVASYYGKRFNGRRTASGEAFNMNELTAAHKTLPFGTRVLVTNPSNGKSVTVRINDRGPYAHGRMIDLSRAAATEIGLIQRGSGTVELSLIEG